MSAFNFDEIPQELREPRQWVCWKYVKRNAQKPTKVPLNPASGLLANVTDPATWGTFNDAKAAFVAGHCDGIGFVFSNSDPYVGIDLDDPGDDAEAFARHAHIIEAFDSYTEVSPSGRGYHIIIKADIPRGRRRGTIEMYGEGRFFTMTGWAVRHANR